MANENPYDSLSEQAKAKLYGCETPEQILALAQEEGYELSDEELDGVSGGWLEMDCGKVCNGFVAPQCIRAE